MADVQGLVINHEKDDRDPNRKSSPQGVLNGIDDRWRSGGNPESFHFIRIP